jgi:RNA polymerase subunit RPABC4/transcription elongation factor Spt4
MLSDYRDRGEDGDGDLPDGHYAIICEGCGDRISTEFDYCPMCGTPAVGEPADGPMAASATLKVVDHGRNRKNIAHAMLVNVCPYCGQTHESSFFTKKKWDAWLEARKRGAHVQSFWSELSPTEREEFFISGLCDKCWPKEEEDDDA